MESEGSLSCSEGPSTGPRSIQSIQPHLNSLRSTVILSSHLRLGLPSGLFPSGFFTKILYAFLFSPILATCPAHRILHDLIIQIILGEKYKLWSSSSCSFLYPLYNRLSYGLLIKINVINMLQAWHMWLDVSNQAGCRGHGSLAANVFCGVSFEQRKPLMGFLESQQFGTFGFSPRNPTCDKFWK
jgi:hypothetical protein